MTSSKISSAPCARVRCAQPLEELPALRQQAVVGGHRLDDDRGDPVALAREQLVHGGFIIERQHARTGGEGCRHAGGGRAAEGREAGAGRDQQVIRMPVVAAGELDDQIAPGERARQADGAHDGLGAGGHQPHLLDAGIGGDHALRQLDFRRARCAEGRALTAGLAPRPRPPPDARDPVSAGPRSRRDRDRRGRPHRSGARRAAHEEERRAADCAESAHRRVDAPGDDAAGALVQLRWRASIRGVGSAHQGSYGSGFSGSAPRLRLRAWAFGRTPRCRRA